MHLFIGLNTAGLFAGSRRRGRVGAISKAFVILRYLAQSEPLGVNAIAKAVGIGPSSCFYILKALVAEDALEFDPQTKTYRWSENLPGFARNRPSAAAWIEWLRRELQAVADETGTSCGLWQLGTTRASLIAAAESSLDTRIHLAVGQRLPLFVGAMGRCVAAASGVAIEELPAIIGGVRWQVPPTAAHYARDLASVRARHWAVDDGNYLKGVVTVAAGIAEPSSRLTHCLTATTFAGQADPPLISMLGDRVAGLAKDAARRLQGRTSV